MSDPATDAYNRDSGRSSFLGHVIPYLTYPGLDLRPDVSYVEQYPLWRTLRDCYAGEVRVKSAGELYLRKLSAHDTCQYETYLSRGYFYNAIERTHKGLMGSLFRKPPEVTLPPGVNLDLNDVTLDKEPFAIFAKTMGHELLLTGRFGILADFRDDARKPYLAGYQAENIYATRHTIYEGRRVLDRVILVEHEPVYSEYGRTSTQIIRILLLDPDPDFAGKLVYSQRVIRPHSDNTQSPAFQDLPIRPKGRSLRYIPFVIVNPTDLGADAKSPPLANIAMINISHYASTAHLEHGRFYAGMPTYVVSGDEREIAPGLGTTDPLTVGPSNVWDLPKDAKAWLLEFTGHGLTFLENAVDSKQLQMQSLGGRLISSTRRAAPLSSEGWQLMETGDEATLLDIAETADVGMALAIAYMADIRGEIADLSKHGVVVEFNKEFIRSDLTARELRALQSLYERGIIPADVMFYALREVNVIPIEYSLEDFTALLKKKDQIFTPPPIPLDPNRAPPGGLPGVRPPRSTLTRNPPNGAPD